MRRRLVSVVFAALGAVAPTAAAVVMSAIAPASPLVAQGEQGMEVGAHPVDPLSIPRPSLAAARVDEPIRIDGRLDEAAWSRAVPSTSDFIQVSPSAGLPASERTEIRILYDQSRLYIGATLYEAEPGKLIVPGLEQDFDTHSSDIFGVAIDTYHDHQNGFLFAVNPAGALFDAQTFNDQRDVVKAWEGIWEVRTTIGPDRWTVEMAIPFATLRYNPSPGEQVWGINFSRRIRHLNEESNWAPTPRQFKLYKFSMEGTLTGLRDLEGGRNLWIKPYVLGDHARQPTDRGHHSVSTGDVGLDAKWGLTPRLTLDLTTNTDFSQVEVDQEQVNLTRFSLFFPEKRDFFLENEGTFAFQDVQIRNYHTGSSSSSFKLFHSRRIGLSPDRTPLPIAGGARLTGKVGDRLEVGFLNMQTRTSGDPLGATYYPAENFGVARVKAQVGTSSAVGAMFVNRQQTAGVEARDYNRSYGVDGNFNLGDLVLTSYVARTDERSPAGSSRTAAMIQAAWRDAFWDVSFLAKHVGSDFNPGLGFVDRTGVRRAFGTVGGHQRLARATLVEVNPYVDVDVYTNLDGILETRNITPTLRLLFRDGGELSLEASDHYERLFEVATIAGADVGAGIYAWREASASYTVPASHKVSGSLSVSRGDFFDGKKTSVSAATHVRPNEHISFELGVQHNALTLGGEDFDADLYSARVRYARNVRTFFMGFLQYNQSTDELISNVRFNFIHAPLSDLFLVYTERRSLDDKATERVLERGLTLKVTRLVAF
ncbi:MAG: carbohydrate binding family 9 domain-containing protein [Gemmatimonadetes bacterium]|nr:carbohydrate binding family 9 domain-containing protein [Gemmatimonadota bacterium]